MWDQGGQPWQQWPLNQQQWMQSFQHQQDPSKYVESFVDSFIFPIVNCIFESLFRA